MVFNGIQFLSFSLLHSYFTTHSRVAIKVIPGFFCTSYNSFRGIPKQDISYSLLSLWILVLVLPCLLQVLLGSLTLSGSQSFDPSMSTLTTWIFRGFRLCTLAVCHSPAESITLSPMTQQLEHWEAFGWIVMVVLSKSLIVLVIMEIPRLSYVKKLNTVRFNDALFVFMQ